MQNMTLLWFDDEACQNVYLSGGKGASLARMTADGLPIPPGFVLPADALVRSVDAEQLRILALTRNAASAQTLIQQAKLPREEILAAYKHLGGGSCPLLKVAVRSSACAEDSASASYAGQQETFLNVSGGDDVCARVLDCWSSFFSEHALFYRSRKGSLHDLRMAVVVQKMLLPQKAGVLFTVDPVSRRRDRMVIEAVFGLGEQVVSGSITPDHYVVDRAGEIKREQIVAHRVLEPEEMRQLAKLGSALAVRFNTPQDIEWAIEDGRLYLLQARPITTL